MKTSVWIGIAFVCLLASIPAAHADERVLRYDSTITVQTDGSLDVHEVIQVRAEGRQIRRGIYRDFPTVYPGRDGREFRVGFDFRSARRDGSTEPWHTEYRDNGIRIYLGDANTMLAPGEYTYEIDYHTDRQLGFFPDHDELYWNVTGNGWPFTINEANARIILPDYVPQDEIRMEAYTGPQGAKGKAYFAQLAAGVPSFTTTQGLDAREGLTIVVMWPKGFVTPPVENAASDAKAAPAARPSFGSLAFRDASFDAPAVPATVALGGIALLLLYYYGIWNKVGRDPPARIAIPEYEPPPGISPGGMRYLMRWSYDDTCFAADVLNLAVKGHLVIDEDKQGLFGLSRQFTLIKQPSPDAKPLSAEEQALLAKLFSQGQRLVLEQTNHAWVSSVKTLHRRLITGRYSPSFFRINGGWHFLGIFWSLLVLVGLVLCANRFVPFEWYFTTPLGWTVLVTMLAGLILNGVFGKLLKAATVQGRKVMDHVLGFKMYLEVAEGEDLKRVTTPPPPLTPELYHAYLPAALGLGVEQRWGERFASVFAERPDDFDHSPSWYSGSGWDGRHLGSFASSLGSQLNGAISSASTAPGSSSGSSSGGGGGGSSGGGGGGGGGGGW